MDWLGRKPRVKSDYINAILDIGYTYLFNFVECCLNGIRGGVEMFLMRSLKYLHNCLEM